MPTTSKSQSPAAADLPAKCDDFTTLGEYLERRGYGEAFRRDHLLPQAAAIWSASMAEIHHYPACAFVRFFENPLVRAEKTPTTMRYFLIMPRRTCSTSWAER